MTSLPGQQRCCELGAVDVADHRARQPAGLEGISELKPCANGTKQIADRLGHVLLHIEFVVIADDRIAEIVEIRTCSRDGRR